ncbi:solute carrier family 16 member 6a [Aplochiton taeniatus]
MAGCVTRLRRLLGPNVYTKAPDGGWGWLVAGAFFLVEVFTYGVIKSFGIFLQDLKEEFGESVSRVSWIISICVFVMTFMAPLSSVLTNRFGFQPVVMVGGLLIATGTVATGFTSSVPQMYVTTGVVAGLGYCLSFLPTVTILSQYFDERRSLVTAVASTGESISIFALAPALSALRDAVGWRKTMMTIGALQGTIIFCGALLRPIVLRPGGAQGTETLSPPGGRPAQEAASDGSSTPLSAHHQEAGLTREASLSSGDSGVQCEAGEGTKAGEEKVLLEGLKVKEAREKPAEGGVDGEPERRHGERTASPRRRPKLLDFSVLREGSFICYSLFGLFATLGFFAPPLYVIELGASRGVQRQRAAYMLSVMAVAEVLGRLSVGWVMSRRRLRTRKPLVLLGCVVCLTAVLVAFAAAREFWGLAGCCGLYGFFMGTVASTHIPMLAEDDVVGIQRMPSAAGVYVFIQSFAGLAGPPLGGVLVDMTQNYGSAFYSCAVGMGLGAVFLGLVRPAKRGLPCLKKEPLGTSQGNPVALTEGKGHENPSEREQVDYLEVDVDMDSNQEAIKENGLPVLNRS